MPRLFVAVWPPEDLVSELMTIRRKDQRGVRFVTPENWHVTLRFLGETDVGRVLDVMDDAELPSAVAHVGPGVDVLSDRVLAVPVTGLDDLAGTVIDRTRDVGEPPPRRRFHGHLTIARITRAARMPDALGAYVTGDFDVEEVALVRSRLEPDGARYETIETWSTVR